IEVLLRPVVIVKREVDGAQIRISSGTELRIGRQPQRRFIARFGLPQISVLLGVDSQIQLAGRVQGFQNGGGSEVNNSLVDSPLPDQRVAKIIFGHVIVPSNGQSVRPKTEIV